MAGQEGGTAPKVRKDPTQESLVKAGIPVTGKNRVLYNLSGVVCWVILFAWLPLLIGEVKVSALVYWLLVPSILFAVPGTLYLLTNRKWPAFALCLKEFMRLMVILTPIWLPGMIMVRVMTK